ncbi:MAG: hypothetical protein AAFX99_17490, partial [Myxococcota bacterium]
MVQHMDRFQTRNPKRVTLFPLKARWSEGSPQVEWEAAPQVREGFARRLWTVWRSYTSCLGLDPNKRLLWYPIDGSGYVLVQLERDRRGRWTARALLMSQPDVVAAGLDPFIFMCGALSEWTDRTEPLTQSVAELSTQARRNLHAAYLDGSIVPPKDDAVTAALASQLEALRLPGATVWTLPSQPQPVALGLLLMAWPRLTPKLCEQLVLVIAPDADGAEVVGQPRAVGVYTDEPLEPGIHDIAYEEDEQHRPVADVIPFTAERIAQSTRSKPTDSEWDQALSSLSASWERPRPAPLPSADQLLDQAIDATSPSEEHELRNALQRLAGLPSEELIRPPHHPPSRKASGHKASQQQQQQPPQQQQHHHGPSKGDQEMTDPHKNDAHESDDSADLFEVEIVGIPQFTSQRAAEPVAAPLEAEVVSLPERLATVERQRLAQDSLAELAMIGVATGQHPSVETDEPLAPPPPPKPKVPELTPEERLLKAWGLESNASTVLLWQGLCGGDAQWHLAQLIGSIGESFLGDKTSEAFPV